jgi:hypothetical protein
VVQNILYLNNTKILNICCTHLEPSVDISPIEISVKDTESDVSYCTLKSFRGRLFSNYCLLCQVKNMQIFPSTLKTKLCHFLYTIFNLSFAESFVKFVQGR